MRGSRAALPGLRTSLVRTAARFSEGCCHVTVLDTVLDWLGRRIARGLTQARSGYEPFTHADPAALQRALLPADVLPVAGNRKLSTAIKYLTQSNAVAGAGNLPLTAS